MSMFAHTVFEALTGLIGWPNQHVVRNLFPLQCPDYLVLNLPATFYPQSRGACISKEDEDEPNPGAYGRSW
jgi:hypothetical protein